MSRKIIFGVVVLALAMTFAIWRLPIRSGSGAEGGRVNPPAMPAVAAGSNTAGLGFSGAASPQLKDRKLMSEAERLKLLEALGQVPEDADQLDWHLAQETTWWGKPLDPKQFWTNRVIWLDGNTWFAAHRRGRGYPPMPFEDSSLPRYPDDEKRKWGSGTVEGPNIRFVASSKEAAFWDKFSKTHPKPPDELKRWQALTAERLLRVRASQDPVIRSIESSERARALELGFPEEALDPEALFWACVLSCRQHYATQSAGGNKGISRYRRDQLRPFGIDESYILEPLTEAQLRAAEAWKVAYLQRLSREKADESYINAYLNAWNLSATEVFGSVK